MGISDDIHPKKYRPVSKSAVKSEIKIADKKIKERDNGQLFQQTHDGDFFDNTPIENNHEVRARKSHAHSRLIHSYRWLYVLIIILAIIALIGVAIWQNFDLIKSYFNGSYKEKNSQNLSDILSGTSDSLKKYDSGSQNQTSSQATNTTPQVSAVAPTIDKSTIVISVLNGSGVKNSASGVANTLKQAGFSIKGTGNARSFNYAKTYIYYKEGKQDAANLVKDALTGRQTEAVLNNSVVGKVYDIVVVVGKN